MKKICKIILFPLYLIELSIIYFYKLCISPFLSKSCRYVPTCSSYSLKAIKDFGIFKGTYLTIKRILSCNPKSKGGFDPVPINIKGEFKWLL